MTKKIWLITGLFFILSQVSGSLQPTLASGLRTNTDANTGQVRVVQDGDTRYLSTQTNGEVTNSGSTTQAATPSGTAPDSAFAFNILPESLPSGFFTNPSILVTNLINIAFIIAVLLAFFFLISAGFDWITSGGDRGKVEGARGKIVNVVIGIVIVAASYAILTLALQLLGYESLPHVLVETQQNIRR
jgi:preprotein translocase subunit SecG